MKAIVINEFGAAEQLKLVEVAQPQFSDDQLLIKVIVAGLNPVDTKIRSGKHVSCKDLQLPAVLGKDMSGIVVSVGTNVQGFEPGDAVFGCIDQTYAEYVVAHPDIIVKKPANISFEAAAAVSLAGLTAYQAIHEHLKVSAGQRILIQSAAGGVGHLAVQFAKLPGAHVSGTASGKNRGFLRSLGVDQPIDYREEDFSDLAKDLDAVMDTMGGSTLYRSISCVKTGGRVVCLPSSTKGDPEALSLAAECGVDLIWFMMRPQKDTLQLIADLLEAGKLSVSVEKVYPMRDIVKAHQAVEAHGVCGKIVIAIADPL